MQTLLGFAWFALGCSGGGEDSGDGEDSEAGSVEDSASETHEDRSARLEGVVLDGAGTPLSGSELRLCRGPACRNGETDEAGSFLFEEVHVDWHAFEIKPPTGMDQLATAFAPLVFATDEIRTLAVVLPTLDAASPLPASPTELEVGAGLFLTLDETTLEPPLFVEAATEVSGIQVEGADQLPVDLEGTVLGMWYLEPFDHEAPDGVPVRVANQWDLAEGVSAQVWVGSYGTSVWLEAGSLEVSGASLEGDAFLPLCSTVVLLAP